jgi:hypothetical protein
LIWALGKQPKYFNFSDDRNLINDVNSGWKGKLSLTNAIGKGDKKLTVKL